MEALTQAPSLLNFVDAPVVVSDAEGTVVFWNPAFEECFTLHGRKPGESLAELFDGGARESVLNALAASCAKGSAVRFRMRDRKRGFLAVASPIIAEGERVGAVLLLTDEPAELATLGTAKREIQESLQQLSECMDQIEDLNDPSLADLRAWVAEMRPALSQVRRATARLDRGDAPDAKEPSVAEGMLDPAQVVRAAAEGVEYEVSYAGVDLEVFAAQNLPALEGDGACLQQAVELLLRARLTDDPRPSIMAVSARLEDDPPAVAIAVTDVPPADVVLPATAPPAVAQSVSPLQGRVGTTSAPDVGRTTTIRLPLPA